MTTNYYYFTIPQRPPAKSNMYGVRVVGKRAIMYTKKELEEYELLVGEIAGQTIPHVLDGYHSLYLRVYQKGRLWIDVDNVFKGTQDGMDHNKTIKRGKKEIQVCETGVADDRLFQLIIGERIIVESAEEQRVEVVIAPYEGIFKFVDIIREIYGLEDDYYKDLILP